MVNRNAIEMYALAVCWAATIAGIAFSGWTVFSVIQLAAPEVTMRSWTYENHQTNDRYWEYQGRTRRDDSSALRPRPPEERLTQERLDSYREQLSYERRDGLRSLLQSASFLLVTVIVFAIHWALARRIRRSPGAG